MKNCDFQLRYHATAPEMHVDYETCLTTISYIERKWSLHIWSIKHVIYEPTAGQSAGSLYVQIFWLHVADFSRFMWNGQKVSLLTHFERKRSEANSLLWSLTSISKSKFGAVHEFTVAVRIYVHDMFAQ